MSANPWEEGARLRRRVVQLEAEAEIAKRVASYDDDGPGPTRKYRFVVSEQANFPVRTLWRVCGAPCSAYYAWAARGDEPTEAVLEEAYLANLVWGTYWASRGRYGSPRVCAEALAPGRPGQPQDRGGPHGSARARGPLGPPQAPHDPPGPSSGTGARPRPAGLLGRRAQPALCGRHHLHPDDAALSAGKVLSVLGL